MVHGGAALAIALHAWAFFVGDYLPYIDWSNHLGLISVLAHGGETGALAYVDRSWAPTPYMAFYAVTALVAQLTSVSVAAKVSLLIATGLCTYGGAYLAERTGRSPRLGLLSPLALFGYSLGYGFASFVFAVPFLFFVLGATEALLEATDRGQRLRGRWLAAAAAVAALYLSHALRFGVGAMLVGGRATLWALARLRAAPRRAARGFALVAASAAPIALVSAPLLLSRAGQILAADEGQGPTEQWFAFAPLQERWAALGGHLLERGSVEHWLTMKAAVALFGLWCVLSVVRAHPADSGRQRGFGLEIYAGAMTALYLVGPASLAKPMSVWMVYPRFGILAAALIFLLPRPNLTGWIGAPAALLSLGLVAHNASITRGHVERFSGWAKQYDPVRALVPPGSRVLALTIAPEGDLTRLHPALGSLYFYHLADGAAYSAFLFDNPLHPVRPKLQGRPRAPFWREVHTFDPKVHGVDFDYLVLRGPSLTRRADASPNHAKVAERSGWTVYRTLDPTPKRAP